MKLCLTCVVFVMPPAMPCMPAPIPPGTCPACCCCCCIMNSARGGPCNTHNNNARSAKLQIQSPGTCPSYNTRNNNARSAKLQIQSPGTCSAYNTHNNNARSAKLQYNLQVPVHPIIHTITMPDEQNFNIISRYLSIL